MKGSDLAVLWIDSSGQPQVKDYHSFKNAFPLEDAAACEGPDGRQSYVAFSGSQTATHTTVTFGRLLDTGDSMDHPITDDGDATRLLFAFSPTNSKALGYHGVNRGAYRMNLFQTEAVHDPVEVLRNDPTVKEYLFLNNGAVVAETRTTYVSFILFLGC